MGFAVEVVDVGEAAVGDCLGLGLGREIGRKGGGLRLVMSRSELQM